MGAALTKPLAYYQLCKRVSKLWPTMWYVFGEDAALVEDVVDGFRFWGRERAGVQRSILVLGDVDELITELDTPEPDRLVVVRDAGRVLRSRRADAIMFRVEREMRAVRVVFVDTDPPPDSALVFFYEHASIGEVRPPSHGKVGEWVAARSAGQWDYHREHRGALVRPEDGVAYMEHCGWSWLAALQGLRTVRAVFPEPVGLETLRAVVPAVVSEGYGDALAFRNSRREALGLAEGVLAGERLAALRLLRWRVRMFGLLRSIEAIRMSAREVNERTGLSVYQWNDRYRPAYAAYTNERIRRRLVLIQEGISAVESGVTVGVLELVAQGW